ncbi:MAG: hypothetical protein ACU0AU_13925 [Cognatishimia activa]
MTDFSYVIDQTHSIDHVDQGADSTPDERPQFKTRAAREKQRKREATERSNASRSRLKDQASTFDLTLYGSQLLTPSEFEEIKAKTSQRRKALGQLRRWMQKHDFKDVDFRKMIYFTLKTTGYDVAEDNDFSLTIVDAIQKMQDNEQLRVKLLSDADTVAKMRREKHILS